MLPQLEAFLEVARLQNLSRAAESLYVSQPTVTARLQNLEASLDEQLFVRGEQRYTRTAEHVYRYESGTYAADIAVDEAGLVTDYDEWRRIGAAPAR